MIKVNEHNIDRIVRFVAGLALILGAMFVLSTPWNLIAYILGAVFIVTGVIGFCPIYSVLHMSTAGKQK